MGHLKEMKHELVRNESLLVLMWTQTYIFSTGVSTSLQVSLYCQHFNIYTYIYSNSRFAVLYRAKSAVAKRYIYIINTSYFIWRCECGV
jgi:hypothetical protein